MVVRYCITACTYNEYEDTYDSYIANIKVTVPPSFNPKEYADKNEDKLLRVLGLDSTWTSADIDWEVTNEENKKETNPAE